MKSDILKFIFFWVGFIIVILLLVFISIFLENHGVRLEDFRLIFNVMRLFILAFLLFLIFKFFTVLYQDYRSKKSLKIFIKQNLFSTWIRKSPWNLVIVTVIALSILITMHDNKSIQFGIIDRVRDNKLIIAISIYLSLFCYWYLEKWRWKRELKKIKYRRIGIKPKHGQYNSGQEIKKVLIAVPNWVDDPCQPQSQILHRYLNLLKINSKVTCKDLEQSCSLIKEFRGNYIQMINYGESNPAKVFEEKDGFIHLWDPVEFFIVKKFKI